MFIEEYLEDVRKARFSPRSLWRYVRRVARRVRADLVTNPAAVRSVWSVALGFIATAFVAAVLLALFHDRTLAYEFLLYTSLWVLATFALVTVHLGMLRDRAGYRLSALNVPTVLTLLRIASVPGIILFLVERHFMLALCLYVAAALTDVFDGFFARRWNQVTRFGTVFDPIFDIIFNVSMFAGLAVAGLVPGWVFGLAVLRYGILLVGGAAMYLFVGPVRIRPTAFGRMTGVVMSTLLAFLVLIFVVRGEALATLTPLTEIGLGVLMSLTVVQAVILGWYNLRVMTGEVRTPGRVVGDVRWDG